MITKECAEVATPNTTEKSETLKYFDTFAGIGGFALGIQQAYEDNNQRTIKRTSRGHNLRDGRNSTDTSGTGGKQQWGKPTCVGFSEIDKYAVQIYQKHFDHKNYGNIREISTNTLPDFDLLCGGFPCQAFSIAGKRGGFDDTRGTLFFELARIARAKRPRLLFFENVKGLLSHDGGRTFDTIIRTIDELGYDCQWQVLNSKNFGVPQNRERVFIIGHLRGTPRPQVFPFRQDSQADIVLPTLTSRYYGGQANGGYIRNLTPQNRQGNRVYATDGISQTLAAQTGGKGGKTGLYAVPLKFLERNQKNYQGEYSFTVDTANTGGVMQDMKIRRLTPTECCRLQGFPDTWCDGVSDSQKYKVLGNAVTVNVIQAIAEKLL